MKSESLLSLCVAVLLAALAAFGGLACLVTGYAIPDVNYVALALFCLVAAAMFGFCIRLGLGLVPLCASALLLGYLWNRGGLNDSLQTLVYHITDLWDRGYGWGVIRWNDRDLTSPGTIVYLLGSFQGAVLTALLLWRKQSWLPFLLSLLPLLGCLILTDTLPELWSLIVLFTAALILLLTGRVRSRSPIQGGRLIAMLALPVAAAVLVFFASFPLENYRGKELAQQLEDWVTSLFQEETQPTQPPKPAPLMYPMVGGDDPSLNQVDLTAVGPRENDESMVMKVTAPESGYLYLRGSVYNYYTGTTWMHNGAGVQWPEEQFDRTGTLMELEITTQQVHGLIYTTYNPTVDPAPTAGRIVNSQRVKSYTVRYLLQPQFDENWAQLIDHTLLAYDDPAAHVTCLNLPKEASDWAGDVLHDFDWYAGNRNYNAYGSWALAHEIAEYVALSTTYDTDTAPMPAGQTDFASWFMQESASGYCVHFATAAAVLLRQAGIPARYVTGYLVQARADEGVIVRQKDAHAWVEYFVPGVGWLPLEATPGYYERVNSIPEEEEKPPQETTVPPVSETTEPTTQPTTQPETRETTVPPVSQTTAPTSAPTHATATTQPPERDPETAKPVLWALLALVGLALVIVQWRLRVWLWERRKGRGSRNHRCLLCWREAKRLCRLLGTQPPEPIHEIAQQARFGPEDSADLKTLQHFVAQQKRLLRHHPWYKQIVYTIVLGLY